VSVANRLNVSAVIPVYNGERYVAESIRSVLNQTADVECVVVDDGSTDGTPSVLASFGSRIVVVRQEHRGVSAARNAGMAKATGDAFAFLDADDVWLPHKVACQIRFLRSHPLVGAAYSGFVLTDEHLAWRRVVLHWGGTRSIVRALLCQSPGLGFSFTGVVRRRAVDAAGGFDESLSNCADVDFWWRLSRMLPVMGIRRPLALYRQHPYGQMHLDYEEAERELHVLWDAAARDGLPAKAARRATASMAARVGLGLVRHGDVATGMARLGRAAAMDWWPVALLPAMSLGRRLIGSVAAGAFWAGGRYRTPPNGRPAGRLDAGRSMLSRRP
jgi:hypothetical protein